MKLVIVESPSKAKTIEKYLKELGDDFVVRASVGHVRDLPKSNKKAIDFENGFKPSYEIVKGKEKIIKELKDLAQQAEVVYLASDPDREGEAIAWHLKEVLNLPNEKTKRVVFHEITKDAIVEAFSKPRKIDTKLKEAQEARRVLDRLVGYDLSGLIWKKVRYGLSAGRVQSPALRILMEREREIRAFKPEKFFRIFAELETQNKEKLQVKYYKDLKDENKLKEILDESKKNSWFVINVKETESSRTARAPFTTSTLQQVASTRLGFSPSRTMRAAQKLYEKGLITYMRTDSTALSKQAMAQIAKKIESDFGKKYVEPKQFVKKSKNAQEAHEAIRPTDVFKENAGSTEDEKKLYRLIWQRAVASQAASAKILKTKIETKPDSDKVEKFVATGSRIIFDGWLKIDPESAGEDVILPALKNNDELKLLQINAEEKFTEPPKRFTEAGLIKELEKRGIGRPSTYASIIKTLKDRGYVELDGRTLIPTDTGDVVSSFLEKNFAKYISDTFTAEMEDELDEIAQGKREYTPTLKDFYEKFSQDVKSKENIEKLTSLGDAPSEFKCPVCSGPMEFKLSKSGKFMSCKKFPACQGARKADGSELEAPKETGENCPVCGIDGEKPNKKSPGVLVEKEGRFGKFIACSNYPKCKYIKKDALLNSSGVKCPVCQQGEIVERRGRFGVFYSCSRYPDCKFAMKARPTGNKCQLCGALMMEGTKTIPERCSDKTCPNHRPDKLQKK